MTGIQTRVSPGPSPSDPPPRLLLPLLRRLPTRPLPPPLLPPPSAIPKKDPPKTIRPLCKPPDPRPAGCGGARHRPLDRPRISRPSPRPNNRPRGPNRQRPRPSPLPSAGNDPSACRWSPPSPPRTTTSRWVTGRRAGPRSPGSETGARPLAASISTGFPPSGGIPFGPWRRSAASCLRWRCRTGTRPPPGRRWNSFGSKKSSCASGTAGRRPARAASRFAGAAGRKQPLRRYGFDWFRFDSANASCRRTGSFLFYR
mmetsp:Transcript_17029/g.46768  ORF Transcript_17029/g.46768 Transcript_17029/m.46768 type:complete len:257 (+) Transcript_17029:1441-2211(+)